MAKKTLQKPVRFLQTTILEADGEERSENKRSQLVISRKAIALALPWKDAVADFLMQIRGSREEATEKFYRDRLKMLVQWAEEQNIPLTEFRARQLREYLGARADVGVSDRTRRHDAAATRAFLKFCMREEYIEGNPLAGFQVPKAARAYIKCPSDDEIRALLKALQERWKPSLNPSARFVNAPARLFYSRRNYAIITGLIETAARIGEMLSLTLEDYQPEQRQIVIRKAKGDEPRVVPISDCWVDAVDAYLRVRPKVESNLLFINEFGEHICVNYFGRQFKGYLDYAGLSGFTLHGLRHYAITQLAKTDVWAASIIAGHKDLQVTRQYLHEDPIHVRATHDAAAPLSRLLVNVRSEKQSRKRVI